MFLLLGLVSLQYCVSDIRCTPTRWRGSPQVYYLYRIFVGLTYLYLLYSTKPSLIMMLRSFGPSYTHNDPRHPQSPTL